MLQTTLLTCKAPSTEVNQSANKYSPVSCHSSSTGAEKGKDQMGGEGNLGATPVGFRCLCLGIHCVLNTTPYFHGLF